MAFDEGIFGDIATERGNQERARIAGRFPFTPASLGLKHAERLPMLTEELGEIARQVLQQPESGLMPTTHAGQFDWQRAGAFVEALPDAPEPSLQIPIDPEAGTEAGLRKELVQLAALAVAWIEAIDSGHAAPTRPTFKPQSAPVEAGAAAPE